MSFIHWTRVGHFERDPVTVVKRPLRCVRPVDCDRLNRMLAELPPETLRRWVRLEDGSVRCQWTPASELYEFAYRLAKEEGCMAIENDRQVSFPPEAAQAFHEMLNRMARPADEG